jgi:hypothetical protein
MKNVKFLFVLFLVLIQLYSCDRPKCDNTNQIFKDYDIESLEYNEELVKEIQRVGEQDMTHWVAGYLEKDSLEYLIVHFQSKQKDFCTKGYLKVNDWTKMKYLREDKAIGWRGAELIDLTYDIEYVKGKPNLVFKDLKKIFD